MTEEYRFKDCRCLTCKRSFHHLGIARHRAMHRDRQENCRITLSDGYTYSYAYEDESDLKAVRRVLRNPKPIPWEEGKRLLNL